MELPKHYNFEESEKKWQKYWDEQKVYSFDTESDAEIYSIDTPPPTVSGKMHIGHAFSYTQQDFIVRFKRMTGHNIFYPFGIDNNGIPSERLIEKMKGVVAKDMSRDEFRELCLETLEKELKPKYIEDWKRIGISCDLNIYYSTIDEHCQRISQRSFIELYKMGREYRKDAPFMWCPECQTGISQVECEDKEIESHFNYIVFKVNDEDLIIATTRPELLPACVAIFYHPTDKRYQKYEGKKAKVPLFDMQVPIMPDERADPEKGTGIVMCCTFGDQTDMEWQKAYNLPIIEAIGLDGKITKEGRKYEGLSVKDARIQIIKDLKESGLLIKQEPITHTVNVHERCGTEIEFIKSKQWFIKYMDLKEDMLKWGAKLNWYPKHMKSRYDHWVKGLQWDWLISRQRHFGIPFPVWYCEECDELILAEEKDLPVDPLKDKPPVKECPKCKCKKFVPEKDVLDTWATSSLTPRLAIELMPEKYHKKLFPMSLRPQAHDIITFWLFNTVVKSQMHYKKNPWKDIIISGHAQDSHGKKMSKSKGNVVEPQEVIAKYGADCLRFWAAGSKLGDDLPYQEKDLVTGQKTITKLWNASKFVLMHLEDYDGTKPKKLNPIDEWLLSRLHQVIKTSTDSFNQYEYSKTRAEADNFFWNVFCDQYLELCKDRLYNPEKYGKDARKSAQYTLYEGLSSVLKLMAPIMPYITEELYGLYFKEREGKKSIHLASWPEYNKHLAEDKKHEGLGDAVVEIVNTVRKFKSENSMSLRDPIKKVMINPGDIKGFESIIEDLKGVTKAENIEFDDSLKIEESMQIAITIEN